ncbi:MAG: M14 family zinc carboxypeptidase, partial [Gammaproteobacteria bacterium]|nr:M14 family zinc carboxypeptidase [Gammaproteobacteria bacterium]
MTDRSIDTYLNYDDLSKRLLQLAAEQPHIMQVKSIGKSFAQRDIWLVSLTQFSSGPANDKPALWIDANIHSSELVSSMAALNFIQWMLDNENDADVQRCLETRTLYICPRVNPDGAEWALAPVPKLVRSGIRAYPYEEPLTDGIEVQDIDGDGLLELVVCNSGGSIYAFDTIAPAPGHNETALPGTERIRSEVTYFGEDRQGVAQHTIMPGDEDYWTAPLVAPQYPGPDDNQLAIPISTSELGFKLRDEQGDPITYSVTTSPDIGSVSDSIPSGTSVWNELTLSVSGLSYDTTYYWTVAADDGVETTTSTFTFHTELAPPGSNDAPTQDPATLSPDDGVGNVTST